MPCSRRMSRARSPGRGPVARPRPAAAGGAPPGRGAAPDRRARGPPRRPDTRTCIRTSRRSCAAGGALAGEAPHGTIAQRPGRRRPAPLAAAPPIGEARRSRSRSARPWPASGGRARHPMPALHARRRAEPVTFGHWCLAYVEMLHRDVSRLETARDRADECPLGSGALRGPRSPSTGARSPASSASADRRANSLDAVSDRDGAADYLWAARWCCRTSRGWPRT